MAQLKDKSRIWVCTPLLNPKFWFRAPVFLAASAVWGIGPPGIIRKHYNFGKNSRNSKNLLAYTQGLSISTDLCILLLMIEQEQSEYLVLRARCYLDIFPLQLLQNFYYSIVKFACACNSLMFVQKLDDSKVCKLFVNAGVNY